MLSDADRNTARDDGGNPLAERLIPGVPKCVHVLGGGGAGVSGAARILRTHGHVVSAGDRAASEHTQQLAALGVELFLGERECARVPGEAQLVVRSAAVSENDPAVQTALARGLSVIKYSELLARLCPAGRTIAVAGTHGKTTTSWMTYHALRALARSAGAPGSPLDGMAFSAPGALIGGICRTLDTNACAAQPGGWFVVEACEYDRSFLQLSPRAGAITNLEADHLDYYGTMDALEGAFARFADRLHPDGLLVVGKDVSRTVEQAARCEVWRLGREIKLRLLAERTGYFAFALSTPRFHLDHVVLGVPGQFNVDNAALALALTIATAAKEAQVEPLDLALAATRGLEAFRGTRRRFEPWGEVNGVRLVHDYAHHPTEVRVTLETARRVHPGLALCVLFQPHQHSRTARFLTEFAEALRFADRVVVADVYGARSHIDGEHQAGAADLVDALEAMGVDACAGGDSASAAELFCRTIPVPCAAFVLGAGDIVDTKHVLLEALALRRTAQRGTRR